MLEVYPIGKARFPAALDTDAVRDAVAAIARLPEELRQAVDGCRDLDHHIREGAWSIRALVHHLADSHMNAYVRTKLALTEDSPTVRPYDEVAWSRLADSRMDVGVSLDLLDALHLRWVSLLDSLGPAELERPWQMPGGEPRPLWRLPITYAWHGRHHVAQIRQAREAFGV
ncbi:MAG TPA: putative metal-dependent hydrolase [Trueperaceae bacterium]|nr:putative metal-dependent hydrolase [Trueperaceae bacterium]